VEMLRLLDAAVLLGNFTTLLGSPVTSVMTVSSQLTSPRVTGVTLLLPPTGLISECDHVVVDTGGCDDIFNLSSPYAHQPITTLATPDGDLSVATPCTDMGSDVNSPKLNTSRTGSVIFLDSRFVDKERSVPNLLTALPTQAKPYTAIALTHTPEQWAAALQSKALLVFSKLLGPLTGTPFSSQHLAVIREFLDEGGHVVIAGSPMRAVDLMNSLFDWSVADVSPQDGGIVFVDGTVTVFPPHELVGTMLGECTPTWFNQNSFNFVASSSLPLGAQILFQANGDSVQPSSSPRVLSFSARYELSPTASTAGNVLFFGFDFYDAPSRDTVCVFMHAIAWQYL